MADSPIPLYHQVSTSIQARIANGEWQVGDVLPAEWELERDFGVSRATVRQAIGELVEAGYVSRSRGRGTTVLPHASEMLSQRFQGSLSEFIEETRRSRVQRMTMSRGVPFPRRVGELLGLDEPVGTLVKRTRLMEKRLYAITINYLPDRYGKLFEPSELRRESLLWLLQSKGVSLESATQVIHAQVATKELADDLEVLVGSPLLFAERVVYGPERAPVQVTHTWYRADRYEFTVELQLKQLRSGGISSSITEG